MLFESFVASNRDEDFEYRGYDCKIPFIPRRNAYGAAVYLDGKYKLGLKGFGPLQKSIDWAKQSVDGLIKKQHSQ